MLKQAALIDVCTWELDAEFGVFPQGARAKEAYFSPQLPSDPALVPRKRYLFKRSKGSYPDQFWGEVVAYRIGCLLGLEVPPAFAAWNSQTGLCAALIEWFYVDGEEVCILVGDFLTKIQPGFDREHGRDHNLRDSEKLLRALSTARVLPEHGWKQWWVNALLFDALIGNTDRHQDNWAILFKRITVGQASAARISPLFDNGTSLGHERFPDRVASWQDADIARYVSKGTHQISWSLEMPRIKGHIDLLRKTMQEWPETRPTAKELIYHLNMQDLVDVLSDLKQLPCPVPLSNARFDFICRVMGHRLDLLRELFS